VPTDVPNAFATGRSPRHSAVAVTRGLWERLEPREVEGVLAHELAHIAHRDVLIMTLASFFSMVAGMVVRFGMFGGMGRSRDNQGAAGAFAIMLVVSLVTYALSWLLIMAISRYREFAADRGAALVTGAPENLMSALQKIASGIAQIPQRDLREVERMNAFFIVPTNWRQAAGQLFMTHPPLEKRLERLAAIAQEMGRPVPA
jgi:heat shock protein HtpX